MDVVIRLASGQALILDLAPPPITQLNLGGWTNPLGQLKDWLVEKLAGIAKAVWDLIRGAWDAIIQGISTTVGAIKSILDTVAGAVAWVKDNLIKVADWVWEKIQAAWGGIIQGIFNTVGAISSMVGNMWGYVKEGLGFVWDQIKRLGAVVMDAVGGVATAFLGAIKDFFGMVGGVLWEGIKKLMGLVEEALSWVADRIRGALSFMYDQLVKLAPRSTEEVPEKLPQLITNLGLAGVGTMVALDAAGIQILGSGVELSGLKQYLKDIFSPGLVQGVLIGAILTGGIGPFVNRWVAKTFRTWLPSPEEAYTMWRQGYISDEELRGIFQQHGTCERWMAARIDLADYTPPITELLRVAQYTDLDPEWLAGKLRENRVAKEDEPKYLELFLQTSLRRIHIDLWDAVESALAYGVPSETTVLQLLTQARLRSFLQPYYQLIYQVKLNTNRVRWWIEAYEEQVYRGLLTPEDALERMLALGVDKSYAMARIAYQMARRGVLWLPPGEGG